MDGENHEFILSGSHYLYRVVWWLSALLAFSLVALTGLMLCESSLVCSPAGLSQLPCFASNPTSLSPPLSGSHKLYSALQKAVGQTWKEGRLSQFLRRNLHGAENSELPACFLLANPDLSISGFWLCILMSSLLFLWNSSCSSMGSVSCLVPDGP